MILCGFLAENRMFFSERGIKMSLYDEVLRYLGHKDQQISTELEEQINKYIAFFDIKIKPKYMYRIFDVEVGKYIGLKDTNVNFIGKDIYNHLKNASKCAVMVATLGIESERILNYLSKTKISEAILFDAVCTAEIEAVCDKCEEEIKNKILENDFFTNYRYSPGYGDFPLESQRQIVSLIGCDKGIGLTVTDSSLLIPRKSVTAVIGIFENKQILNQNQCASCNLAGNCQFQKTGKRCRKGD